MKKGLLILLMVILLSGCSIKKMNNYDYVQTMNKILSLDLKISNKVGKGYKYYAPRGVIRTDANSYNDVLKRNNNYYYLYVDVVSYYYKSKLNYKADKTAYYSKSINKNGKTGYLEIKKTNGKLFVKMVYNYAKIESYVDEKSLKNTISDISYILSSVDFNDALLKKMYESGNLGSKEEVYRLFDDKENKGNFLEYVKEYDKYDGTDTSKEEEIKVESTTTTKKTTTEVSTTTVTSAKE